MPKNFKDLIDALEKKWDAEIVPAYQELKNLLSGRILSSVEAKGIINKLKKHYSEFYTHTISTFASYSLNETEQFELNKFLNDIKQSLCSDIQEFTNIYNNKAALIRSYFFQKNAARLPLPTFEEQYITGEIFPSDPPEEYPQYYTYDFK